MKRLMMLLVLLSGTAIAQDDPPDTPEKRLQEAWYMEVANGRYEEALAIYDEVLALPGLPLITRVQTQLRKAQTLRRLGRIEESRAIAEEIVRRYQAWPEDDPRAKKARELTIAMGELERLLEKKRSYLSDRHPEYRKLQEQLEELRAQYSDISHFLIPKLQRAGLWKLAETAQQELLGENTEQATLNRKIESLIARLSSEDEATRNGAISALKRIGPEVIPFALEALRSGDYYTCEGAASVLVHYGYEDEAHLAVVLTALRQGDAIAQDALSRSFADQIHWPIPVFRQMIADDSAQVRETALELLDKSPDLRNEREALYAALDDPAPEVRALAVGWLIFTAPGEDPQPLKDRLPAIVSDPDPAVRRTFARFANNHFPSELMPEMVTAAIPLLRSDDRETARWTVALMGRATQAFWREGDDRLLPRMTADQSGRLLDGLEHLLRTAGPDERRGLVFALLIVENDRSRDLLFRSLEDPEDKVAEAAASALGKRLDEERVVKRMVEALDDPRLVDRVTRELQNNLEQAAVKAAMLERLFELPEDMLSRLVQRYPEESVQRTLKSLDAFDRASPDVQDQILVLIGNLTLEEAAPTVLRALRSENDGIFKRANWVVGRMPSPRFVPAVIELLRSGDEKRVEAAIDLCRQLDSTDLVEPLGELLDSEDVDLRQKAIQAMARLNYPSRLPIAIEALTDEDPKVADNAGSIVNRILWERDNRPAIEAMLALLPRIHRNAWSAFETAIRRRGQQEDALPMARALESAPDWMQSKILELLALDALVDPDVAPYVRPLTDATDQNVRRQAQYALLRTGTFEDILALVDGEVGTNAIRALGKTGDARAIPVLLEQLAQSTGGRAAEVVEALEPFAPAEIVPALVENAVSRQAAWHTVKSDVEPVEWKELASVRTLVHYPPEAALDGLARILSADVSAEVRLEVIGTLTRFEQAKARELILSQLDSESATVRTKAIEALGTFLDADLLPMLVDLLRHRLPEVRQAAQASIEKIRFYLDQKRYAEGVANGSPTGEAGELVRMLEHEEAAVRVAAAQALGRLHDPATLPALLKARKDRDENVRKAVEAALDMFAD